jgi:hypothetical protein
VWLLGLVRHGNVAQPLVGQEQPDEDVDDEDPPGDPAQRTAQVERPAPCTNPNAFIHSLLICNTPTPQKDPEAFHPMPAGYKAYADAIKTKLPSGGLPST